MWGNPGGQHHSTRLRLLPEHPSPHCVRSWRCFYVVCQDFAEESLAAERCPEHWGEWLTGTNSNWPGQDTHEGLSHLPQLPHRGLEPAPPAPLIFLEGHTSLLKPSHYLSFSTQPRGHLKMLFNENKTQHFCLISWCYQKLLTALFLAPPEQAA